MLGIFQRMVSGFSSYASNFSGITANASAISPNVLKRLALSMFAHQITTSRFSVAWRAIACRKDRPPTSVQIIHSGAWPPLSRLYCISSIIFCTCTGKEQPRILRTLQDKIPGSFFHPFPVMLRRASEFLWRAFLAANPALFAGCFLRFVPFFRFPMSRAAHSRH